jgi:hypothetical protein
VDLRFLRELTEKPGPFATVYLDASHDTEDAARAIELRWSEARVQLADQGADAATVDALAAAVGVAHPVVGRAGRVLVARGGEVVLDRTTPEPPPRPRATWGPLPDLLPLLVDQPEPVTAVVVRVDETGGEIFVVAPDAAPERLEDVDGGEYPVHKVRGGGWSHLNMQERVEESWRRNTAQVAERVDRHISAIGAQVLVIAGDPRSRSRLFDALAERAAAMAVQVDRTGGESTGLDDLAAEAVQDAVTDARRAVLERYDQAAGRPDGLAVQGLEPVLAALRAEAVDTLLVDAAQLDATAQVWVSDVPSQVATSEADLTAGEGAPTGRAKVDAAILRAAAATGAAFVPMGGGRTGLAGRPVADGVAALLRYPMPSGA